MEGTDKELMRRIAGGDPDAMRDLYARHADRLLRFALSRLGEREAALDVVQETMVSAWQAAESYRGASSVSTWLFGICRNKIGEIRRRRRITGEPIECADRLQANEGAEATVELWECLGLLSDEDQELILLVFHYGFSQQEVAEILGIPVGTVKSRTHHARRRMQELLEGGE